MPREKSRYREKRSSSYSSESSYERKKSKSKHKRRSRSRDRSESSTRKRKRSTSRSRHRRRSYSRSLSRDRYEKSRRRSQSRSKSKRTRRSVSRERRSVSRSSSRSKKYSKGKHKSHRRSRSASSRSSSVEIEKPVLNRNFTMDDTESKLEKAIKAAAAAGLTMTKIPTYEYKEIEVKEEMPTIHDRNLLAELNNDSFVQKAFTSTKNKKKQNIVIDLNTDTVKLPDAELKVDNGDSIINFDALPSEEELVEMWIKKLYQYRKKMLKGEI